jgi:predicted nucleic acid-binding protein
LRKAVAISIVVDSTAFLALALKDEYSASNEPMERAIAAHGGVVPPLWIYEVQNALLTAERAGRITGDDVNAALATARQGFFTVDSIGPEVRFGAEVALARLTGLSAYDAAYLDLAQRRNIPLMTLDRRLESAARELGLAWEPGYSPLVAPKRGRRLAAR